MPPKAAGRGGRGGARGAFNPARGTINIGGTELNWDLSGLDIEKQPAQRFPDAPPPQAPPPTEDEREEVQQFLSVRDHIHEGPFYTILNDGMKNGLKRKANEPAPTEASLFDPFTDNQTYSAKYLKLRRRVPKLDSRPYVMELFPSELHSVLNTSHGRSKKRKILSVSKISAQTQIERMIQNETERTNEAEARAEDDEEVEEEEEEAQDDDKPDAVDEEDNYSAVSSDSEESDDDYNAEQYFDNGEDEDLDEGDPNDNTYE